MLPAKKRFLFQSRLLKIKLFFQVALLFQDQHEPGNLIPEVLADMFLSVVV